MFQCGPYSILFKIWCRAIKNGPWTTVGPWAVVWDPWSGFRTNNSTITAMHAALMNMIKLYSDFNNGKYCAAFFEDLTKAFWHCWPFLACAKANWNWFWLWHRKWFQENLSQWQQCLLLDSNCCCCCIWHCHREFHKVQYWVLFYLQIYQQYYIWHCKLWHHQKHLIEAVFVSEYSIRMSGLESPICKTWQALFFIYLQKLLLEKYLHLLSSLN